MAAAWRDHRPSQVRLADQLGAKVDEPLDFGFVVDSEVRTPTSAGFSRPEPKNGASKLRIGRNLA
jgi:hypothetical protein